MKNYKNKALLLSALITVCFVSMYAMLTISSRMAFLDVGAYLLPLKQTYFNIATYFVIALLIAFLPYELLYIKISRKFSDLYFGKETNKPLWVSVIFILINVVLGIFGCVVRSKNGFHMNATNVKFQYVILIFMCLCIWINICSCSVDNRIFRIVIRSFANIYNSFLVYFFTRDVGQAIIVMVAITSFIIVYDNVLDKKTNWKEILATIGIGVAAIVSGIFVIGLHNSENLSALSKILLSPFELVDIELGFGYLVLFVLMVVGTAMLLIFSIKAMAKISHIRTGFLIAVTTMYICSFVYSFLAMFEIVPYCEVQIIQNRIHIVIWLLTLRTFIFFPVPTKNKESLFTDRALKDDSAEDSDIDWIVDKLETVIRKQNLLIEYIAVLDLKVEELFCESCDNKEEKLKEISETRHRLIENNVPMNIGELAAKLEGIQQKK